MNALMERFDLNLHFLLLLFRLSAHANVLLEWVQWNEIYDWNHLHKDFLVIWRFAST
jgi:hypothetical protein